jgi:hypothetical protein
MQISFVKWAAMRRANEISDNLGLTDQAIATLNRFEIARVHFAVNCIPMRYETQLCSINFEPRKSILTFQFAPNLLGAK